MSNMSDRKWMYDVFLSFRGEDTRKNFTSHLYSSLTYAGVNTFIDDVELEKGNKIEELFRAIEGSHISILVFSKRFTESSWCVNELVRIMKCSRDIGQLVIPVFYDVDPSDIRPLRATHGEAFERYQTPQWQMALNQAVNLTFSWDVRNYRSESYVIEQIVDDICRKVDKTYLPITNFPVGVDSRVQDVIQCLEKQSERACIVGIWGMGGIGKTTIAKSIYNKLRKKIQYKSFIENIRGVWEEKDSSRTGLQEQLLSDILNRRNIKINSIEWGKTMIQKNLLGKKTLVVLDDVTNFEQLNALCTRKHELNAPGSVLIITTRDVRLLQELKVDYVCEMKEMDKKESLELFSCHAFKKRSPGEDFIELSKNVVAYSGGLPLALQVLGSYLYERTKQQWESILSKLERIPHKDVQKKLKLSFDGLDDFMEKDIFLDICCFFIGKDRAYVTKILDGCELNADIGITTLIERSLLKIEKDNKLGMHDLLRDMGREIVRQSSPDEPEKRSRLWFHDDVLDVLTERSGTKAVKGLALKLQRSSGVCLHTNDFEKMKQLRLLQLYHVKLGGDYKHLPKQLRWVDWKEFPLRCIPDSFNLKNVVAIDLKHSKLQRVWKEPQLLEKLKILNLSHSHDLTKTPDFSFLPNLEELILKDCPKLSEVHKSIGNLCHLLLINVKDCKSLSNLPRTIYELKSVKTFILSGCSNIEKLEEDIVQMESLTTLIADFTGIKHVPFSIVRSKSIGYVSLCGHEGLARHVFPSLIMSWISPPTNPFSCTQPYWNISTSLVSVNVQDYNLGDLAPMLSGFSKVRGVCVKCCSGPQLTQESRGILDDLRDVSFTKLERTLNASQALENRMGYCSIGMGSYYQVINTLNESIQKGLASDSSSDFFLPSDNHPYSLVYTSEGHSVLFQVPGGSDDCHMKGMTLCVAYSSTPRIVLSECVTSVLIINHTNFTIQIYKRDTTISFNDQDWLSVMSNLRPHDNVEIFVVFGHGLTVKKTIVYLIYGQSVTMKTESTSIKKAEPITWFCVASEDVGGDLAPKSLDQGRHEKTITAKGIDKKDPRDIFKRLADLSMTLREDSVIVPLEHDGRGNNELYVPSKEIMEIAMERQMASACHISLWCTYLHRLCTERGNLDTYGFIDPVLIQGQVVSRSDDIKVKISHILSEGNKCCYLAPYLNNYHWQLLVLCPLVNDVVFFCSLGRNPTEDLVNDIKTSMETSRMLDGDRHRPIRWMVPQSRKQTNEWECGYYVMKWMLEIISTNITEKWLEVFNNLTPLSKAEINDIRSHWSTFFLEVYSPAK